MSQTMITAEPGVQSVTISREIAAPPELVYRAYVDPELIPRWWGPRYLTTTIEKQEPRLGGQWRYIQRDPAGNTHGFHGVYHLVEEGRLTVRTFEYEGVPGHVSLETVRFEPSAGGTRVVTTAVFQSLEDRDGMMASGMEFGVNEGFEQLEELLQELGS